MRQNGLTITIADLSGKETDGQIRDIAWKMFCNAHPVEAYKHNPERFWKYAHERVPSLNREKMVEILKSFPDHHNTPSSNKNRF